MNNYSGAEIISDRLFKIWLHFKPIYIFTKLYRMEKKFVQNGMYAIGDEVLKEKELQYQTKSSNKDHLNDNNDDERGEIKKPQIFIDQLLKMREHFTIAEIKDELNTIIIAVRIFLIINFIFLLYARTLIGTRDNCTDNVWNTSHVSITSRCSRKSHARA